MIMASNLIAGKRNFTALKYAIYHYVFPMRISGTFRKTFFITKERDESIGIQAITRSQLKSSWCTTEKLNTKK